MPAKRKTVVGLPQLTPEVLKALVPNPISAGQFEDIFRANGGRGRDDGCPPPPAQIRTCRIAAYGSCIKY